MCTSTHRDFAFMFRHRTEDNFKKAVRMLQTDAFAANIICDKDNGTHQSPSAKSFDYHPHVEQTHFQNFLQTS
jgi:hypothetical protein